MKWVSRHFLCPPSLEQDQFDLLPDDLILLILGNLSDVRHLGRCSAVSKRLRFLVPVVHRLLLHTNSIINFGSSANPSPRTPQSLLSRLCNRFLSNRPRYSPAHVLTNFTHLRYLIIVLPSAEIDTQDGEFLEWYAQFGCSLRKCSVIAGTRVSGTPSLEHYSFAPELERCRLQSFARCLTEAKRRFDLVAPLVTELPTLRALLFIDADGQGTLDMEEDQLRELREMSPATGSLKIRVDVQYNAYLELRGEIHLQNVSLMVAKPLDEDAPEALDDFLDWL